MPNLNIRPVHPDDLSDLYEMITDPRVIGTLIHLPSMEFSDEEAWLKNKKPGSHRLAAELDGKVVGSAAVRQNLRARMTHSGRMGLLVHADYWGQGIGQRLMAAILDIADNWLNLLRVELEAFTDNPAAIHIYQKFGFEIEGTRRMAIFGGDGRFHDEHVMSRLRRPLPPQKQTPPPTPDPTPRPPAVINIRPFHADDADDLHRLWSHPMVDRTTLQMPSLELAQATARLATRPPNMHRLAAEADGRVIGCITLQQRQNPRMAHIGGIGMMVAPEYWRMGIGSRLMTAVLDLADNWLNLKRVELDVNTDNPAGIRLYEKFGFEIEGTRRFHTFGDGRWADSHFMARVRQER